MSGHRGRVAPCGDGGGHTSGSGNLDLAEVFVFFICPRLINRQSLRPEVEWEPAPPSCGSRSGASTLATAKQNGAARRARYCRVPCVPPLCRAPPPPAQRPPSHRSPTQPPPAICCLVCKRASCVSALASPPCPTPPCSRWQAASITQQRGPAAAPPAGCRGGGGACRGCGIATTLGAWASSCSSGSTAGCTMCWSRQAAAPGGGRPGSPHASGRAYHPPNKLPAASYFRHQHSMPGHCHATPPASSSCLQGLIAFAWAAGKSQRLDLSPGAPLAPDAPSQLPLIIFSHGLGGNRFL